MNKSHKNIVLEFLHQQQLAVIATTTPQNPVPESALIAFTEDNMLCIYFQTDQHTRKAINLQVNPYVSLVVGLNLEALTTVQYEGKAEVITTAKELEKCKQRFIAKNSPTTEKYFNKPSVVFFKVSPIWVGYSNYSGRNAEIFEINNF